MEQGDFAEAVDTYSRLLQLDPRDQEARKNLSVAQRNLEE